MLRFLSYYRRLCFSDGLGYACHNKTSQFYRRLLSSNLPEKPYVMGRIQAPEKRLIIDFHNRSICCIDNKPRPVRTVFKGKKIRAINTDRLRAVMNTCRGIKIVTFITAFFLFLQTSIWTDFWISPASARYY